MSGYSYGLEPGDCEGVCMVPAVADSTSFIPTEDAIVVRERTGTRSGIETIMTFYAVWRFRDGRVVDV
jgi:ketosteroid isomerase-like protein